MNKELHETLLDMRQQLNWAIESVESSPDRFNESAADHLYEIAELNETAVNQNITKAD